MNLSPDQPALSQSHISIFCRFLRLCAFASSFQLSFPKSEGKTRSGEEEACGLCAHSLHRPGEGRGAATGEDGRSQTPSLLQWNRKWWSYPRESPFHSLNQKMHQDQQMRAGNKADKALLIKNEEENITHTHTHTHTNKSLMNTQMRKYVSQL